MADNFNFELVSPERLLLSGSVIDVVIPASEGEMTVMAHHAPTMTTIKPGVVKVHMATGKSGTTSCSAVLPTSCRPAARCLRDPQFLLKTLDRTN